MSIEDQIAKIRASIEWLQPEEVRLFKVVNGSEIDMKQAHIESLKGMVAAFEALQRGQV